MRFEGQLLLLSNITGNEPDENKPEKVRYG